MWRHGELRNAHLLLKEGGQRLNGATDEVERGDRNRAHADEDGQVALVNPANRVDTLAGTLIDDTRVSLAGAPEGDRGFPRSERELVAVGRPGEVEVESVDDVDGDMPRRQARYHHAQARRIRQAVAIRRCRHTSVGLAEMIA